MQNSVSNPELGFLAGLSGSAQFRFASYLPPEVGAGHLPFLAFLLRQKQPATLVSAGARAGLMYFALCQALLDSGLDARAGARCHAFELDDQAGAPADPGAELLRQYHRDHFQDFSSCVPLSLAQSVAQFQDASIDMLLLGPLAPHQDPAEHLQAWLPKLAPGAVLLVPQTNLREGEALACKLWLRLAADYPQHLEFTHDAGLGVLVLEEAPGASAPAWLLQDPALRAQMLNHFQAVGLALQDNLRLQAREIDLQQQAQKLALQQQQIKDQQRELAALNSSLLLRDASLREIQGSASWRLTQPLRAAAELVRRARGKPAQGAPQQSRGLLGWAHALITKILMALCLLPATFFQYYPAKNWLAQLRRGKSFFGTVLRNPTPALQRLAQMPRAVRLPASVGISLAQKLAQHGGVWPLLRGAWRLLRRDGWRSVWVRLQDRVPQAEVVVGRSRYPRSVLVADLRIPRPDVSAGERATFGIIQSLVQLGFQVTFLPADLAEAPGYQEALQKLGVQLVTKEPGIGSPAQYLARHGHKFGLYYLIRLEVAEAMLELARKAAPAATVVFHAPDLHYLREQRETAAADDAYMRERARQTQERELQIMRAADQVVVVSPEEQKLLRAQLAQESIALFPALYAPLADFAGPEGRQNIFFVGGFDHRPNQQAVMWFASEIWPLVRERLPEAEFHIFGANPPAPVKALEKLAGVRVFGHTPDLEARLAQLRVAVAPLTFGAGIKGKVALALGAGIPCVCTTIAAEGMDLQDGQTMLLADDAAGFAQAVIALYTDEALWLRLSEQGRTLVANNFSAQANTRQLLELLNLARALPLDLYQQYCAALPEAPVAQPPAGQEPRVSIVVHGCNDWDQTRTCINSILFTCRQAEISYELILADDASVDETVLAAQHFQGLLHARSEEQIGVARICNLAAQAARGEYLVLVSNQAVLLPNWLTALVALMDAQPDVAMAGPKTLYPDGSIRDAGSHLFADGVAISPGRGLDRDIGVFNIPREVDAIGGLVQMIRASFWRSAGGFAHFGRPSLAAPQEGDEQDGKQAELLREHSRWHDVELASMVHALQSTIIYQPDSEVVCCDPEYYAGLQARPVPQPPAGEAPLVSIVIPAYNQWQVTRTCINSVLAACDGRATSFEIILADDSSTDDTRDAAQYFPGLVIARTAGNQGFLRNCNQAVAKARGQYVLLLNNDTIVLPGWLEQLVQTMVENPDAGIAGSRILYVDGSIQEAGAHLFNDATAANAGRYQKRLQSGLASVREVDYISGCSIIIRKSFWDQVGGFDTRYRTAYCEDSDLAMSARAQGLRVLYQPQSELVHYENQSYSQQSESSSKLQAHNTAILRDKWAQELARDYLAPGTPEYRLIAHSQRRPGPAAMERRRSGKLNILYYTPFPSHPASHGNRSTIQEFARYFQSQGHKLHFALLQYADQFTAADVRAMQAAWDSFDLLPFGRNMQIYPSGVPWDGWFEEGLGEHIAMLCARYDIDILFCSYVFQSRMLEYVPDYILKVIDTHDKMGNRYEMLRANGQPLEFFSCTPEEEGAYLRRADLTVARRAQEAEYFNAVSGTQNAIVIPHVEPPRFLERGFTELRHVGMVASANRINLALMLESLEAIGRQWQGAAPPFTVHIAGQVKDMVADLSAAQQAVFRQPWLSMHGFVDSIADFYAGMDLIVSPVTMGTGINVKTVQAMAYGMPLLTTMWGSKGIETGHPMHQHEDLAALAASIKALAADPSQLQALAQLSRERYLRFYNDSLAGFGILLGHPKLQPDLASTPENS